MSLILNIETATPVCSVSLGLKGELLGFRESAEGQSHASHLTLLIEGLMECHSRILGELDAIAVSKGPGSYTGLRIGVSTAKGLCYALEKPLISVNTLRSMAAAVTNTTDVDFLCPMIDARRMEVYCAVFDRGLREIQPTAAVVVGAHSFANFLERGKVLFFGDGAGKCRALLKAHKNAVFLDDYRISASSMVTLATEKFARGVFEDTAYFEPFYLKDFVAGKPAVRRKA